ncbi:hypothetical protein DCO15_08340 [Campylobacter coli]|nr:hypothetical protein [Campylobacter coli]EAH8238024.1 hypothetical protein [Campylobacter coli]EAH8243573.1 hypothetical protein [Campylobacter coli]EAI8249103.1 hypothetical protein [Campylobacter coli]EAI9104656.1 hypothetical protein [Campylobacter coli]
MFKIKTTPKVVSFWSRALQKAVSYFLDLKNIFLISSLKSVINTFESIELKKEEEEKFTLDFLIESNKTSVLSVFKGKII